MEQQSVLRSLALIPCYNEEHTVGNLILKTKPYVDTVLVVDDGSSDKTTMTAQNAGAVVLAHPKNKGKGAAIKTGFHYALAHGFDDVVTIDGDGQHDPGEIPIVLSELRRNGHDIVIGTRFGPSTEMPFWRKIGKRVLDYATGIGTGGFVTDSQSGFRAFNKKAIKTLIPLITGEAFSVESEQLIKGHEQGLQMGSARVSCKYNGLQTSTKTPSSHGFSVLQYVLRMLVEKQPLLFIGVPSMMFILLGLLAGLYTLLYYNSSHILLIPHTIIFSIMLLIGVLGLLLAVLFHNAPYIVQRNRRKTLFNH
jgi:glycosyltransferase involved in cell wall biosynthesis